MNIYSDPSHKIILDRAEKEEKIRRNRILQNWKYLESKLLEAGFVENGSDHGLKHFKGMLENLENLKKMLFRVSEYGSQTHFHYNNSKIIAQLKKDFIDAWCC